MLNGSIDRQKSEKISNIETIFRNKLNNYIQLFRNAREKSLDESISYDSQDDFGMSYYPEPFDLPYNGRKDDLYLLLYNEFYSNTKIYYTLKRMYEKCNVRDLINIVLRPRKACWIISIQEGLVDSNFRNFPEEFIYDIRLRALSLVFLLSIRNGEQSKSNPFLKVLNLLIREDISVDDFNKILEVLNENIIETVRSDELEDSISERMSILMEAAIELYPPNVLKEG